MTQTHKTTKINAEHKQQTQHTKKHNNNTNKNKIKTHTQQEQNKQQKTH